MRAKKVARVEEMFRLAVARARSDGLEIGQGTYGVCLSDNGQEYVISDPPICPTGAILYYVVYTWSGRLQWPSGDMNADAARLLGVRPEFVAGFVDGFDDKLFFSIRAYADRSYEEGYLLGRRLQAEFCPVSPERTTE